MKDRQTKRWEGNIISECTGLGLGEALPKAEDRRGMEKSGCPIILAAPTVIQTTGCDHPFLRLVGSIFSSAEGFAISVYSQRIDAAF